MTQAAETANRAATFQPQTSDYELPMIAVAGVCAFLYVDPATRTVRVSINLDDVEPWLLRDSGRSVPLQIIVQDQVVFEG